MISNKKRRVLKSALTVLACGAMVMPTITVGAAQPQAGVKTTHSAKKSGSDYSWKATLTHDGVNYSGRNYSYVVAFKKAEGSKSTVSPNVSSKSTKPSKIASISMTLSGSTIGTLQEAKTNYTASSYGFSKLSYNRIITNK